MYVSVIYGLVFSIYIVREVTEIDASPKKHSTNLYLNLKEMYTGILWFVVLRGWYNTEIFYFPIVKYGITDSNFDTDFHYSPVRISSSQYRH